jgi:hypothetical protein
VLIKLYRSELLSEQVVRSCTGLKGDTLPHLIGDNESHYAPSEKLKLNNIEILLWKRSVSRLESRSSWTWLVYVDGP